MSETILSMLGATTPSALDWRKTAVIAIDFQQEYFSGRMPIADGAAALRNANKLIAKADASDALVVHVQHIAPDGAAVFARNGPYVALHDEATPAAHHLLVKKTSVSVFASTDLAEQLKGRGITTLLIAGLMTHACVAGAARDAVPAGFDVIVAGDACATRDVPSHHGRVVRASELHEAALASIADTFGAVMTTEEILALVDA